MVIKLAFQKSSKMPIFDNPSKMSIFDNPSKMLIFDKPSKMSIFDPLFLFIGPINLMGKFMGHVRTWLLN